MARPQAERDELEALLEEASETEDVFEFSRMDPARRTWVYIGPPRTITEVKGLGLREFARQTFTETGVPGETVEFRARVKTRSGSRYRSSRQFQVEGRLKSVDAAAAHTGTATAAAPAGSSLGERLIFALAVPVGLLVAKKMMEDKPTDPLMLELVKMSLKQGRGEAIDPVELQKLLSAAEEKGEKRGRELGELTTLVESGAGEATPAERSMFGEIADTVIKPLIKTANRYLDVQQRRDEMRLIPGGRRAAAPNHPAGSDGARGQVSEQSPASAAAEAGGSAPPPPPADLDTSDPLVQWLGAIPLDIRKQLIGCAIDNDSPRLIAEISVSKLTDDAAAELAGLVDRPDFVDVMCKVIPAVNDHREWFTRYVDALRETFGDDDEHAGPEERSA